QIQALTQLVTILTEQNEISERRLKLTVVPDLWLNGASIQNAEGKLKIDLNNKGKTAYLDQFVLLSGDIILEDLSSIYELMKGERRFIFAKAKGTNKIIDCEYEIKVLYHDVLNNTF